MCDSDMGTVYIGREGGGGGEAGRKERNGHANPDSSAGGKRREESSTAAAAERGDLFLNFSHCGVRQIGRTRTCGERGHAAPRHATPRDGSRGRGRRRVPTSNSQLERELGFPVFHPFPSSFGRAYLLPAGWGYLATCPGSRVLKTPHILRGKRPFHPHASTRLGPYLFVYTYI